LSRVIEGRALDASRGVALGWWMCGDGAGGFRDRPHPVWIEVKLPGAFVGEVVMQRAERGEIRDGPPPGGSDMVPAMGG
jgi:hypothetical protein